MSFFLLITQKLKNSLKKLTAETRASIPPSAQIRHDDSEDLAAATIEADDERRPCCEEELRGFSSWCRRCCWWSPLSLLPGGEEEEEEAFEAPTTPPPPALFTLAPSHLLASGSRNFAVSGDRGSAMTHPATPRVGIASKRKRICHPARPRRPSRRSRRAARGPVGGGEREKEKKKEVK